ncbi:hypothetical protein EGT07_24285 [Herbaspirillum sp. HC18]|nr:hypothetical protein EGT07_24285 [Herbaspirillum sp. HC18]
MDTSAANNGTDVEIGVDTGREQHETRFRNPRNEQLYGGHQDGKPEPYDQLAIKNFHKLIVSPSVVGYGLTIVVNLEVESEQINALPT